MDDDGVLDPEGERGESSLAPLRVLRDAAATAESRWMARRDLARAARDIVERRQKVLELRAQVRGQQYEIPSLEEEQQQAADYEADEAAAFMNWSQARAEYEAALDRRTAAMEERAPEEISFWTRRFHTSLAIAHGGAFLAIANRIFAPGASAAAVGGLVGPMVLFSAGLVLAGLIPVANFSERPGTARTLAWSSASAFLVGLILGLDAAVRTAGLAWPWQ